MRQATRSHHPAGAALAGLLASLLAGALGGCASLFTPETGPETGPQPTPPAAALDAPAPARPGAFYESAAPTAPRTPADALRLAREADVARLLGGFTLSGKVSVAASSLPANANLTWVQQGNDFDMHLIGAFGAGATRLSSQDGTVTLRTKGGEFITTDPEADLRERLGYAVPVRGLRYWALGLPMPDQPLAVALFDAAGHPVRYRQGPWTVEYADWRAVDGHDLPRLLEAHTATADNKDEARFRLAINEWSFGPPKTLPEIEPPAAGPTPAPPAGER